MKFKLDTSGSFYNQEKMEPLKVLGFKFRKSREVYGKEYWSGLEEFYKDSSVQPEIELNSLEELIDLCEKFGEVVVRKDWSGNGNTLEIYDDYRE